MASDGRKRRSFLPAPKKSSSGLPAPSSYSYSSFDQPHQQFQQSQYNHPPPQQSRLSRPQYQYQHNPHQQQQHQQQQQEQQQPQQLHYQSYRYQQERPQYHQYTPQHQQQQQQSIPPPQQTQYVAGSSSNVPKRSPVSDKEPLFGKGLRVGAKVKIGGVKPGIIRYLGTTHLAPGIFCGIELFDPEGSHDGEVNGHRYFSCAPKHGIFAPKDKVCLDTSRNPLARVYDSDLSGCSSTESLAEKSNQAFRKFSEGDIEAVEVSPSSPERADRHSSQHFRRSHGRKTDLNSTYDLDLEADDTITYDNNSASDRRDPGPYSRNSKNHRSLLPSFRSSSSSSPSTASYGHQHPLRSSSHTDSSSIANDNFQHFSTRPTADCDITENISPIPQSSPKSSFSYLGSSRHSSRSSSPLVSSNNNSGSGKSSEDSEEDGLSRSGHLSSGIKQQLSGDNRRYLNFTFDRERSDGSIDLHNNTFDVVTVPHDSDERGGAGNGVNVHNRTFDVNTLSDDDRYKSDDDDGNDHLSTTRSVSASDLPDILIPSVNNNSSSGTAIEEDEEDIRWTTGSGCCVDKVSYHQMEVPPPSSSKTYDSSSKKTEEATADPSVTSRHNSTGSSTGNGGDSSSSGAEPRTESSSDGSKGDNVDDSSNGISPEASQTLEWDYGQEFEGKVPNLHSDNNMSASASTGTSESLSDVLRDVSEHSDNGIEPEFASGISLESDQFEVSENEFESIDKLEDFTFFGKDTKTIMTDSGISEKDIESSMAKSSTSTICGSSSEDFSQRDDDNSVATTKAASSDSSQETLAPELTADTPVSTEVKELPGESDNPELVYSNDDSLSQLDSTAEGDDLSCSSSSAISIQDVTVIDGEMGSQVSPRHFDRSPNRISDFEDDNSERQGYDVKMSPRAKEESSAVAPNLPKLSKESVAQLSAETKTSQVRGFTSREEGGGKRERPISLLSTASGDTGYAPDTDSELGTLTANTPMADWVDQQGVSHPTSFAPLDDDMVLDSPVDNDLIVKESLALSRALCRPNFSSQSSASNASDTEDTNLNKSQQQQLLKNKSGDLSSPQMASDFTPSFGEGGDAVVNVSGGKDDAMSRSILSTSMIQDTDLISGFGGSNTPGEELKLLEIRSHVDMNASIEVTDVDDRVEADRVQEGDGCAGGAGGMETLAVLPEELDALKNAMVGSGIEGEVGSAEFAGEEDKDETVGDDDSPGDDSVLDKSKGDDVENNSKKETEEGKEEDSSVVSNQGKRKYKPLVQKRKRMDVVGHKMPNTKVVASKLADYIKTPTPTKPKDDEKEKEAEEKKKLNKNVKNIIKKGLSLSDGSPKSHNDSRETSVEKNNEINKEKTEKFEKPKPPVIKRTPPKSKWGNIMSQIDNNKSVKPKPKSEIKSSLASYLSSPIPIQPNPELMNAQVMVVRADDISDQPQTQQHSSTGTTSTTNAAVTSSSTTTTSSTKPAHQPPPAPKREFKYRIKPLPPPPPKLDLSKVKSKLGAPTAASVSKRTVRREASPAIKLDSSGKPSRESSPATTISNRKLSDAGGKIILNRKLDNLPSSARSSRTDLSVTSGCADDSSVFDESTTSRASRGDHQSKKERRQSANSVKSGVSDKSKFKPSEKDATARTRPVTRRSVSAVSPSNPTKRHSRTLEIHLSTSASPARSSRHSSTSPTPTPIIIKAVKGSTLGRAAPGDSRATTGDKRGGSTSSLPSSRGVNARGNNSSTTISKSSRTANGTAKVPGKTSGVSAAATSTTSAKNKAAQEIERLESLCESRTKELTQTKIQLKATNQAFDAMSVLLNYCCTELNAFECPQLAANLAMVQQQLTDCLAEITDLTSLKETLTKDVEHMTKEKEDAIKKADELETAAKSEKEEHSRLTKELDTTHNAALTAQRDELTTKHNAEVKKLKERHDHQMQDLIQSHERSVCDMRNDNKMEMNGVRLAHLEEIQCLRNKHDSQMEELHKQHRNKLEDITLRFETIKLTLSEKVESLKGECEDHLRRARCSEEALQKDADVKVQIALGPYLALPKEIDSLKTVLEMRNEEIQKLKTRTTDLEGQLEEIPIAREKIISLQQKVENLEAVINIKTDHEKQLHERCQVLMRKCDRETRANKRLSMDYEQVVWRMSQSEYGGSSESLTKRQLSRSPPRSETTSPDPRRRGNGNSHTSSPNNGEVRLREKKKRCESDSERNLRSRSATFVIDRHSDNLGGVDALVGSPPSSPRNLSASSANSTPLRWKKRAGREDGGGLEEMDDEDFNRRMCMSAGAELISSALNGKNNSGDYNQKSGYQLSSSSHYMTDSAVEMNIDNDNGDVMMMSAGSYARSLSGVSDSGMCDVPSALNSGTFDSMTGSEMLNSSVFSTDSEWADGGKSGNVSMSFDSSIQNSTDFGSGANSGEAREDFVRNSNTVVDMASIQSATGQKETAPAAERDSNNSSSSQSESVSYFQSSCSSVNDTMLEKTLNLGSGSDNGSVCGGGKATDSNYEFQIKFPEAAEEGSEEEVFESSTNQQ